MKWVACPDVRSGVARAPVGLVLGLLGAVPAAAEWPCLDAAAAAKFTAIAAGCPGGVTPPALAAVPVPAPPEPAAALVPSGESPATAIDFPAVATARVAPDRSAVPSLIGAVAADYRIDPALLAAIVRRESAGRASARSPKGALGLMQVMPGTARDLGIADPAALQDPETNVRAGAFYLKRLQAQFGNQLALTLAAYNAGPGAVRRHGGIPPYAETRAYVAAIMDRYRGSRRRP